MLGVRAYFSLSFFDLSLTLAPQSFCLPSDPHETVFSLTERIAKRSNLRQGDLYLTHQSKPLLMTQTLTDMDVHNDATIQCRTRTRGGCFIISFCIFCILCFCAAISVCTCGTSLLAFPFLLPLLFVLPFCCL